MIGFRSVGLRRRTAWLVGCRGMVIAAAIALAPFAALAAAPASTPIPGGPSQVRIVESDGVYRLLVNGSPFRVKGAGMDGGKQDSLVAHGANTFRTWDTDGGREMLDRASANGLFVALGIKMGVERNGFDYDDPKAVAAQFARIKSEVLRYKDHPALLMWVAGNELNLESRNPRVWNAVNQVAEMIHQLDPNHPVMTTLAGLNAGLVGELKSRAPALDLIGIQLYGDIVKLPEYLRLGNWTGPYIVTEWGPTGHWEIAKTSWGAPIEDDSTKKAGLYLERYQRYIAADERQCLGSYVFLWGNKQERTPTWYGLFLASGEETPAVDAMHYVWNGAWPENRSPAISPVEIDSRSADQSITVLAGSLHVASVQAMDSDQDPLDYRWLVMEESGAKTIGGDREDVPRVIEGSITSQDNGKIQFKAPSTAGAYRLFVYVHDGKGHAGHANIPFRVAAVESGQ